MTYGARCALMGKTLTCGRRQFGIRSLRCSLNIMRMKRLSVVALLVVGRCRSMRMMRQVATINTVGLLRGDPCLVECKLERDNEVVELLASLSPPPRLERGGGEGAGIVVSDRDRGEGPEIVARG